MEGGQTSSKGKKIYIKMKWQRNNRKLSSTLACLPFYCTWVLRTARTGETAGCNSDVTVYHFPVKPEHILLTCLCRGCKINMLTLLSAHFWFIACNGLFYCLWIDTVITGCDAFEHFASYFQISTHNRWWLRQPSCAATANISPKEWDCLHPFQFYTNGIYQ